MVAGVLSGNRNFEGRIHPQVRANYLASPMLVVVYGLAGRVDIDLETEPIGMLMGATTLPDSLLRTLHLRTLYLRTLHLRTLHLRILHLRINFGFF